MAYHPMLFGRLRLGALPGEGLLCPQRMRPQLARRAISLLHLSLKAPFELQCHWPTGRDVGVVLHHAPEKPAHLDLRQVSLEVVPRGLKVEPGKLGHQRTELFSCDDSLIYRPLQQNEWVLVMKAVARPSKLWEARS